MKIKKSFSPSVFPISVVLLLRCCWAFHYSLASVLLDNAIIIDMGTKSSITQKGDKVNGCPMVSELQLPPFLTKLGKGVEADKLDDGNVDAKQEVYHNVSSLKEQSKSSVKKPPPGLHRLRMRTNSPKLVSKRV